MGTIIIAALSGLVTGFVGTMTASCGSQMAEDMKACNYYWKHKNEIKKEE